jgi:hypothetical protein
MTFRNGRHAPEYQLAGADALWADSAVSPAQGGSVGVVEASAAGSAEGVADGEAAGADGVMVCLLWLG